MMIGLGLGGLGLMEGAATGGAGIALPPGAGMFARSVTAAEYAALTPDAGVLYAVNATGGGGGLSVVALSQAAYDALALKDIATLYLITGPGAQIDVQAFARVTRAAFDALTPDPTTVYSIAA